MERRLLEGENKISTNSTINIFRPKEDFPVKNFQKIIDLKKKRISSGQLRIPQEFVPKIKPINADIEPSPINMSLKSSKASNLAKEGTEIFNMNIIKKKNIYIIPNLYKKKKLEPISTEIDYISENEENVIKISLISSNSDSADEQENIKKNPNNSKNNVFNTRIKLKKIKENFLNKTHILDDSNIEEEKRKDICCGSQKLSLKKRKNKFLKNLDEITITKCRTKSVVYKPKYVTTILGFLQRNKSEQNLMKKDK